MIAVEVELTKARPCVLSSGIRGLDQLLGGGFIQGSSVLIDGPPGSGKSTVGLRLLHEGITTHDEPGIMLAFEEFPRHVHQAALDAGIDLAAHERSGKLRILWTSPQRILEALQGGSDLLERVMAEMGARRLLVDSITHFRRVAASETSMREVLGTLIQQMKLRGVTTILVKEMDLGNGGGVAFEEYLVDTSIRLHHAVAGIGCDQDARFLEVRKARGLANVGGLHPFELGHGGPLVHARWSPRLIDAAVPLKPSPSRTRVSSGAPGLDAAMGGGFVPGSVVIIEGDAGSGRTSLAVQVALAGRFAGESVATALIDESRDDWARRAREIGGAAAEALVADRAATLSIESGAARFERLQDIVLAAVARHGKRRVIIDTLATMTEERGRSRADMVRFLARVARRSGALIVATADCRQRGDLCPDDPVRSIADTIIILGARARQEGLERSLLVLKHRASAHEHATLPIRLDEHGLDVTPREAAERHAERHAAAPPPDRG